MPAVTTPCRRTRLSFVAVLLPLVLGCGVLAAGAETEVDADGRPVVRLEFGSYAELDPLMVRYGYTPETWQAGVREVPRIYLTTIPPRWRERVSSEVAVLVKKRIFFRTLAPLILRANELILADRARLVSLAEAVAAGRPPAPDDADWLGRIAVRYRVAKDAGSLGTGAELAGLLDELLVRVDLVPVSLVLAQAAEESGWGTSRFAAEGNALFGQWTWSGEGITPQGQREGLGDYRIAAFESPLQSIMAYLENLNSHPAYAELRTMRAAMRRTGGRISGHELAKALTSYSERGQEYVESLHGIMRVNRLDPADDAFLGDTPTIYLVPVDQGAE